MSKSLHCIGGWPRSAGVGVVFPWLLVGLSLVVLASCASMALPTPDRGALSALPTNTPTLPTPHPAVALGPRPSETPSPTPTLTPTSTSTPTRTPTSIPSPTATPTATPGPIARALKFNDSRLARFDANGYTIAGQQSVRNAGDLFLAVIVNPPEEENAIFGVQLPRLLVYHLPTGQPPELLFEDEGSDEVIGFAGYGLSTDNPLGWQDLTGDGSLELPVRAANGGFCFACTRIYVLQLAPVDDASNAEGNTRWQVRELTGAVPFINLAQNPIIPKWLSDFDGNGTAEVEALDGNFEFAFGLYREYSPRIYRPLVWDGNRFTDASPWSPGYFDGQIQRASEAVQATYGQPLASQDVLGKALTALLAHDASGRRDEGWALFWQLSDPVNWAGEAVPGLLDWLNRIREHLRGQYERGEPFAPWPPLAPSLSASSNAGNDIQASNQITQPLPAPPAPVEPTTDPNTIPTP